MIQTFWFFRELQLINDLRNDIARKFVNVVSDEIRECYKSNQDVIENMIDASNESNFDKCVVWIGIGCKLNIAFTNKSNKPFELETNCGKLCLLTKNRAIGFQNDIFWNYIVSMNKYARFVLEMLQSNNIPEASKISEEFRNSLTNSNLTFSIKEIYEKINNTTRYKVTKKKPGKPVKIYFVSSK